ncbi:MAG: hypothetical protein GAK43_01753 [Stenotrophomonas maltophilia]|nr:MAG: hypothetical protein GAK43_01753 [Stenotrophomonas maltophilia]
MNVRDYLRAHEAMLWTVGTDTRIRVAGLEVMARDMTQDIVRPLVNGAVALQLERFGFNLRGRPETFEQRFLEHVGLRLAVHNLYIYRAWTRHLRLYHGDAQPLCSEELLRSHVLDQVYACCEARFPSDASYRTSVLIGCSTRDVNRWLQQRTNSPMSCQRSAYRVL